MYVIKRDPVSKPVPIIESSLHPEADEVLTEVGAGSLGLRTCQAANRSIDCNLNVYKASQVCKLRMSNCLSFFNFIKSVPEMPLKQPAHKRTQAAYWFVYHQVVTS